jgi:hypothetical protein
MEAAFVVRYTRPTPGREKLAIELGVEIDAYYRKAAADGKCTEPETFVLPSGLSIWFVKGEESDLLELTETEQSKRFYAACALVLDGFSYDIALAGKQSLDFTELYAAVAHEYELA